MITPITQPRLNNAKCIKIELILTLFLLLRHILTRNTWASRVRHLQCAHLKCASTFNVKPYVSVVLAWTWLLHMHTQRNARVIIIFYFRLFDNSICSTFFLLSCYSFLKRSVSFIIKEDKERGILSSLCAHVFRRQRITLYAKLMVL